MTDLPGPGQPPLEPSWNQPRDFPGRIQDTPPAAPPPPTTPSPTAPGQPPPPSSPPLQSPPPHYQSKPPQYTPPVGKKTNWKPILAVLGSVLLLMIVGIGACTYFFIGAVKAPIDESNRFLAVVNAGDYAGAAAMTDPTCNDGMSAQDLQSIFQGNEIAYNLNGSFVSNNQATVNGTFATSGVPGDVIELRLQERNDTWGVCGFTIGTSG